MRIGVIGLGSIGLGIAKSALSAGHEVVGADLSQAQRNAFAALGGEATADAKDAARGRIVSFVS